MKTLCSSSCCSISCLLRVSLVFVCIAIGLSKTMVRATMVMRLMHVGVAVGLSKRMVRAMVVMVVECWLLGIWWSSWSSGGG